MKMHLLTEMNKKTTYVYYFDNDFSPIHFIIISQIPGRQ